MKMTKALLGSDNNRVLSVMAMLVMCSTTLVLLSFLLYSHCKGGIILAWEKKPIREFRHETGFAYQVNLGKIWMSSHAGPSPAQLLENGLALGSANAMHDNIRNIGKGQFSFWHNCLYFSTSDNSDPSSNGRRYEIFWPVPINKILVFCIYLATFLSVVITSWLLLKIIREGKKDIIVYNLRFLGKCMGLTVLALFMYMIFHRPEYAIRTLEVGVIHTIAYFICGLLGVYAGRVLLGAIKLNTRLFLQFLALVAIVFFLLMRSEAQNNGLDIVRKELPALIAIFSACLVFSMVKLKSHKPLLPALRPENSKVLMYVIAAVLLIAMPEIVEHLTSRWDISGWMDSHMYDRMAHRIITGETPQGDSYVMPLYQYGLAFFYYVFGHFFYVQQVINVIMMSLMIVLLCLTAWNIFRDLRAVFLTGILAAFTTQFYDYISITQIENWYMPLICLTFFLWSCYWRNPIMPHLILLGASIGLGLNMRVQGAPYFAFLSLSPFIVYRLSFRKRVLHVLVVISLSLVMLLPWTMRNYICEKSFSPLSNQTRTNLLLNDHRLAFYAIRYTINWNQIVKEYEDKYPDPEVRLNQIKKDYIRNIFCDPAWLSKAVFWRTLSLYGVLPPGVLDAEGPKPIDWKIHWRGYVFNTYGIYFLVFLSILGFMMTRDRVRIFLLLAILSNISITILATTNEARYSFPILPLHMLLGLCIFFEPFIKEPQVKWSLTGIFFSGAKKIYWLTGLFYVFIFFALCHFSIGKDNIYRPLIERLAVDNTITIDRELPMLNQYYIWRVSPNGECPKFTVGQKVRFICKTTNYMLPPKTGQIVPYLPVFASDPLRETFYYAVHDSFSGYIGVTYFGATAGSIIKENDSIEAEGTVIFMDTENKILPVWFWVKVDKICKISN